MSIEVRAASGASGHKPTPEQEAFIEAVDKGPSVAAEAYAGTAKSTSIQMAAPRVRVPAIALAFNKKIAMELQPRLPANFKVQTFNGFGHSAWARALPGISRMELDERKLGKLVSQVAKDRKVDLSAEQWDQLRRLVSGAMLAGITPGGEGLPLAPDDPETWWEVADGLWMPRDDFDFLSDMAHEVLERNNQLSRQGIISFDDQIYASACLGGKFPQFPAMFVDEAQDLSPLNHHQLAQAMRPDGKLVAVGDPRQCHPIGTMIQLSKGQTKSIEDIEIGNELVSYNRKGKFTGFNTQGCKVTNKHVDQFDGKLIRIVTDGPFAQECTPNHRCVVRWTDKSSYCLYLMQKGEHFRIGVAQSWYTSTAGGFGPSMRMRQERADKIWVLEAFDSKEAALIQEKVIWTQFGLPDLIFRCSGKLSSTQAHLDAAWKKIGNNSARALACLAHFGRLPEFPLLVKGEHKHIGEKTFLTQACNLINGAMSVKVFDGSVNCPTWLRFWITRFSYKGPVIGLTVESNGYGQHLYIANGIVTHNSIYAFRGADNRSMQNMLRLRPEWQHRKLTLTFRCPKIVVARNQAHAPGFTAFHTNAEGRFERFRSPEVDGLVGSDGMNLGGWDWSTLQKALPKPGASLAILCRNNGPLLGLAFKLLRRQIGVSMLGRDLGKSLIALARKLAPEDGTSVGEIVGAVRDWQEREVAFAMASGNEHRVSGINDRAECLLAVIQGSEARDAREVRQAIERLFAGNGTQVVLGSIHRSKGLEWDCVLHLDPWRIPSKYAKEAALAGDPRQMEQEWNLKYVCETRSKHTLLEGNLGDFIG